MSLKSYIPTVLLVDDDNAATVYWRSNFQSEKGLGVVEANNMKQAKAILDDPKIEFDAIVSDLFFEPNSDAPEFKLFTGIDLLAYSQEKRPDALLYTLSFFAENSDYKNQADQRRLSIKRWIPKAIFSARETGAPWDVVADDLLALHLKQRDIIVTDELSTVVSHLDVPMRTYLQNVGDEDYNVVHPIEVFCRRECIDSEHVFIASALRLGLLQDGCGSSIDSALGHLGELIVAQQRIFDSEPEETFVGLAGLSRQRLAQHLTRRNGGAE